MSEQKQNFENYPELATHIERMASTGTTGTFLEWNAFLSELNRIVAKTCITCGEKCFNGYDVCDNCEKDGMLDGLLDNNDPERN